MLAASQPKRDRLGIDKSQILENVATADTHTSELPNVIKSGRVTIQSHQVTVSDAPGIFSSNGFGQFGSAAAYLTGFNTKTHGRNTAGANTTKNARKTRALATVTYKELGKSIDKTTEQKELAA